MTSEELFKVLPVLEAMKDGKAIQYRIFENGPWEDVTEAHCVDINSYEYRVKPELQYRPFKNGSECWAEMLKHQPFGWVVGESPCLLTALTDTRVCFSSFYPTWEYAAMLQSFTFADGTPFGIKEEQ